ncbi:MAG: molybdopterin-dependent oxidoreductase, partial [candidate division Zixibacteria bacterium]|nr:molybdopterin-dependent oxidoreductase [candidate division Zixibacteria bacterium]
GGQTAQHEGFRTMVTREYRPEVAEEITGVAAADIRRLAREYAKARPGLSVAGRGPELHTNGLFTQMAIRSLNALVGSIDVPGGEIVQQSVPSRQWSDVNLDDSARKGLAQPSLVSPALRKEGWPSGDHGTLLDAVISGQPYATEAAFVYNSNPLFAGPDTARYREALDRIPFVVSFSSFMDETTARADLVLPDSTFLERLEDDFALPSTGYPILNLRQPVMDKLYDTRHTGDVLIELAGRVGGSVAGSFPWRNYEQALKESLAAVAAAGTGSFTGRSAGDFWTKLKAHGFWSGGDYPFGDMKRVLKTPSGKFEFASLGFKEHIETEAKRTGIPVDALLDRLGIQARGDLALMPHYESPRFAGESEQFPLHLQTYKTMMYAEGRGGNQPWLQESFGVMFSERWRPWAEINPETAEHLGIHDLDLVWVQSDRGRLKLPAKLHPGIRPDVVNVPLGYGHTEHGRWAKGIAGNPHDIISLLVDPLTGAQAIHGTRVRVYRAVAPGETPPKLKGSARASLGNGH